MSRRAPYYGLRSGSAGASPSTILVAPCATDAPFVDKATVSEKFARRYSDGSRFRGDAGMTESGIGGRSPSLTPFALELFFVVTENAAGIVSSLEAAPTFDPELHRHR